jgi:predicted acylesterase/phospholipase RssA
MGAENTQKIVNLALQGGGSHGAFTWGVLDRLLEEERRSIDGIAATSAGAIDAVALAPSATASTDTDDGPSGLLRHQRCGSFAIVRHQRL